MSELTPCNYCNVRRTELEANKRGAEVRLIASPTIAGFIDVVESDRDTVSHHIQAYTTHCVC